VLIALLMLSLTQEPIGVTQQVFELSGEVDRIDRAGRMLTIRAAGTITVPIYAGPDMPIFDQLAAGDFVVIRYYDSVIVEFTPGERMKALEDTTPAAQQQLNRDDASVLSQTRLVVTIDEVDQRAGSVTYHGVDNRRVMRVVRDRRLLEGVKPGDVVTITFTRAQAASITKR
jgi:Cu/Ag efflux protein CusF